MNLYILFPSGDEYRVSPDTVVKVFNSKRHRDLITQDRHVLIQAAKSCKWSDLYPEATLVKSQGNYTWNAAQYESAYFSVRE